MSDGDSASGRARRQFRETVERRSLPALAVASVAVLVVLFYYPVATVFVDAVLVEGQATLRVFQGILTDPFYFGELARLFAGESPLAVADAMLSGDRRLGVVGFTAYQAALSTLLSVVLGVPAGRRCGR